MAVRINPCFGCPLRFDCALRADFARRVHGLGLRSATFNCERLSKALAPGTRIVITAPTFGFAEYEGEIMTGRREVKATITSSFGNRFACVVDQSEIDAMAEDGETAESANLDRIRFRKTMRHSRIVRFLDEPAWRVCEYGNAKSPDGTCHILQVQGGHSCSCGEARTALQHAEAV